MLEEQIKFGEEIRMMRKEMHMTQEKLAEALGTNFRIVSRWENGEEEMGALTYRKLQKLHAEKTQKQEDSLLQQISKLSPAERAAIELLVSRMSVSQVQ